MNATSLRARIAQLEAALVRERVARDHAERRVELLESFSCAWFEADGTVVALGSASEVVRRRKAAAARLVELERLVEVLCVYPTVRRLVELAGDLGSSNNVGADEVLERMKSALAGGPL